MSMALAMIFLAVGCQNQDNRKIPTEVKSAASIKMVPRKDVRVLRTTLPGKSMRQVIKELGQPSEVFTLDSRESWRYDNAVRDSVTNKPVPYLEVVFVKRIVQTVNFSY